jgi:hypothetical protein
VREFAERIGVATIDADRLVNARLLRPDRRQLKLPVALPQLTRQHGQGPIGILNITLRYSLGWGTGIAPTWLKTPALHARYARGPWSAPPQRQTTSLQGLPDVNAARVGCGLHQKTVSRLIKLRVTLLAIAQADEDQESEIKRASEGGAMEYEDHAQKLAMLEIDGSRFVRSLGRLDRVNRALTKIERQLRYVRRQRWADSSGATRGDSRGHLHAIGGTGVREQQLELTDCN